ncbi:MAG TPA: thymidine phosphorylase [Candidatus Limnocylindrales bacterium]|nr:thymidine phosphorylase [Candidatus Limnocylindrales bacterium]
MIPARVIERKRDGHALEPGVLAGFLEAYVRGEVPDYQMSAFLMAAYLRGLDDTETDVLVRCMLESGRTLDLSHLPGPRVDKHSTGGVGDKVSIVLAPLVAALGVFVPMMSGRGLGHTTGTLDKLEAIPGFSTDVSLARFKEILRTVGCAMIGQTAEIAPLDKRLYALRDVTGTVSAIPLIAASIMSTKLAEGLTGLLLDVKVGGGAFIPEEERARELARKMVAIGRARDLPTVALLTAMDRPLGRAVGNGLETAEAIRCLRGEGPPDLRELVVAEAAEMLRLGHGDVPVADARARAESALDSGAALERFVKLVEAQGGDTTVAEEPDRLKTAAVCGEVTAAREGVVLEVAPRALGEGVLALGGGRTMMHQPIDPGVGFEVLVKAGDAVGRGDLLGVVHAKDEAGLGRGAEVLRAAVPVGARGERAVELRPLVSHRVEWDAVT